MARVSHFLSEHW